MKKFTENVEKAIVNRLDEYENAGVDGFVFVCQAKWEKNKNVNFMYVDMQTVRENIEGLFHYQGNTVYFRKTREVDVLLFQPNFPIGKKIMTIPTAEFEKGFEKFSAESDGKINKGGYCEYLAFNKPIEEITTDKKLVDGEMIIDGVMKKIQMKSSIISKGSSTNSGCSNAELVKVGKGK